MITRYSLKHSTEPVPPPKTGDKISPDEMFFLNNYTHKGPEPDCIIMSFLSKVNFFYNQTLDWWMADAKSYNHFGGSDQRFSTPPKGCVITLTQE